MSHGLRSCSWQQRPDSIRLLGMQVHKGRLAGNYCTWLLFQSAPKRRNDYMRAFLPQQHIPGTCGLSEKSTCYIIRTGIMRAEFLHYLGNVCLNLSAEWSTMSGV